MVKAPSSEKTSFKKRPWSAEEDQKLINYIKRYGIWNWTEMPKPAALSRSGKSCRLRWLNYLRPGIKRGNFIQEEDQMIIKLHEQLGNRWCRIAARLPGRTDNEIKNHWHTHLKKRLKNNQVPSTRSKRRQKGTVEADQNNPPKVDALLPKSPEVLILNGFKGPPSPCLNREVYQNQPTEENIFSNKEIQSLSEQLFPMERVYSSEDDYGAICSYPEFMVSTSQKELLEDTYTCYDGCFDLWD